MARAGDGHALAPFEQIADYLRAEGALAAPRRTLNEKVAVVESGYRRGDAFGVDYRRLYRAPVIRSEYRQTRVAVKQQVIGGRMFFKKALREERACDACECAALGLGIGRPRRNQLGDRSCGVDGSCRLKLEEPALVVD